MNVREIALDSSEIEIELGVVRTLSDLLFELRLHQLQLFLVVSPSSCFNGRGKGIVRRKSSEGKRSKAHSGNQSQRQKM
ncbi:MAG TPA: hypothetical protein VJO16_08750 [Candidatus Acidoferrum sp.]|nr:hypothetical protein [Candidatus Acidoferrum sp.]